MPKPSPLQQVKTEHGSKADLVEKVAKVLEAREGETPDAHKRRLRNVSNRKLISLAALADAVQQLGGRDEIVTRILELKQQPKDREYQDRLKKLPLGRLIDTVRSLERRAKRREAPAKKATTAKAKPAAAKKPAAKKPAAKAPAAKAAKKKTSSRKHA
jgi:hypothetical protein